MCLYLNLSLPPQYIDCSCVRSNLVALPGSASLPFVSAALAGAVLFVTLQFIRAQIGHSVCVGCRLSALLQPSPSPNPVVLLFFSFILLFNTSSPSNVEPPVINVLQPRNLISAPGLALLSQHGQGSQAPRTSPFCILRHTALPPNVCTLHPAIFERPGLLALYSGAAAPASDEASGNYRSNLIEPQRRLP